MYKYVLFMVALFFVTAMRPLPLPQDSLDSQPINPKLRVTGVFHTSAPCWVLHPSNPDCTQKAPYWGQSIHKIYTARREPKSNGSLYRWIDPVSGKPRHFNLNNEFNVSWQPIP